MTEARKDALKAALEPLLPYRFVRPEHLVLAVTHRSLSPELPNNETLEFLGDAVLGLAMSDLLMRRFPTAREGDLSKRRAGLVNAASLARKARAIDLGRWLRLGKGEEKTGGRDKESILAAGFEAVLGAIYLDGGYEAARGVVEVQFGAEVAEELAAGQEDWKTRLQELCQRRWRETPVYTLVEESGPDHAKRFVSELTVLGALRGRGVGHSKKAAEQAAAREALAALAAAGET